MFVYFGTDTTLLRARIPVTVATHNTASILGLALVSWSHFMSPLLCITKYQLYIPVLVYIS
jgi:hypothetical protein